MNVATQSILATVGVLWRGSPRWRLTVYAAGALTLMAMIGQCQGPSTSAPASFPPVSGPTVGGGKGQISPTLPVDQQAAARLGEFFRASREAESRIQAEGERCEARLLARSKLQKGDERTASPAQQDELKKAAACEPLIRASDEHWKAVAAAGQAAEREPTLAAARAFAEAAKRLDAFDLSRKRGRSA